MEIAFVKHICYSLSQCLLYTWIVTNQYNFSCHKPDVVTGQLDALKLDITWYCYKVLLSVLFQASLKCKNFSRTIVHNRNTSFLIEDTIIFLNDTTM